MPSIDERFGFRPHKEPKVEELTWVGLGPESRSLVRGVPFRAPEGLRSIHTHAHTMATKTIRLAEGAYARLHALKREGESFTNVVDRLTGKFAPLELVGILEERAARKLRAAKRDVGKRLRKGLDAKAGGMA